MRSTWLVCAAIGVLACHPPAVAPDRTPRYASDAEFERAIVAPLGPVPVMPGFAIEVVEELTADGTWAIGRTPEGVPAVWSTIDPARAALAPVAPLPSRHDAALAVAPSAGRSRSRRAAEPRAGAPAREAGVARRGLDRPAPWSAVLAAP